MSEHSDSSNKMFKQMVVMEYRKKDVGLGEFKNMICRGNSSKEKIDTNHKLLIFLHHGNNLYGASQSAISEDDDSKIVMKLKWVS